MPPTRKNRKQKAGGMPLSYLQKGYVEPSGSAGSTVNVSQVGLARPVLNAMGGARRKHRTRNRSRSRTRTHKKIMKGGFFPAVMGSFLQNAKSLLPATAVAAYRTFKNYNKTGKNRY
jgi:hypothetical protein